MVASDKRLKESFTVCNLVLLKVYQLWFVPTDDVSFYWLNPEYEDLHKSSLDEIKAGMTFMEIRPREKRSDF